MKHVFRFIGVVVVLLVLSALVLYFLNGQGYIKGPLHEWIDRMQGHLDGVVHDTQDTINEFRGETAAPEDALPPATVQPASTPEPEAAPQG